ncbi:hypothetical protein A2Z33_02535 [Candidatus Gottesmanbacteria bacterium RBG_16_52_11]|uniref:AAA+ ATPase domain-containing protein n=1 Tax=Candidatus Gottesmanbacteria bacterium RBG_16_52_11 TaxID=1798374 RepID=A0A1F5YML7_9BACT|nr:MAG: hypothetical protein A2Z33_02535 [Candidatus Gottesmanbacteria bacterium RBG_16_52_11]
MEQMLFDDIIQFPDEESQRRYNSLVGLDDLKARLNKESEILLNPQSLAKWSQEKHGSVLPIISLFHSRHPFFIFCGDVGTGKTTLAETFGDHLAREKNLRLTLFSLSLNARGSGNAGEMTNFIATAFHHIKKFTSQFLSTDGTYASGCILLIDEADALAESRDTERMEHEDRAGVNSLIQGLDSMKRDHLPVLIVMCTNRLGTIDPAVRRRAAAIFQFRRPNETQRYALLKTYLSGTGIEDADLQLIAKLTGENKQRSYGYTFSDLTQNLLPALVFETYPNDMITKDIVFRLTEKIVPTPPLNEWK